MTIELPTPQSVEINWMHGYGNTPSITVHVDDAWGFPSPYETWPHWVVDEDEGGTLYLATRDIWAHFVYKDERPSLMRGACTGDLLLESGETVHIASGWSSGADVLNTHLKPSGHLVDVTLKGGAKYRSLGRAGLAIHKTALEELLPEGVFLFNQPLRGPCYVASVSPDEYRKAEAS